MMSEGWMLLRRENYLPSVMTVLVTENKRICAVLCHSQGKAALTICRHFHPAHEGMSALCNAIVRKVLPRGSKGKGLALMGGALRLAGIPIQITADLTCGQRHMAY